MCGIVGVMSSHLSDAEKERFKELLMVSTLRGYEGAGVVAANYKCEVEVFKTTQTGAHLAHDYDFNQRLYHRKPVESTSVLIGHTRWPTKGAVSLETTHPHEHDGIVGVHNGTVDKIMGKTILKDESDSSLLYKSFADNGVKDTIEATQGAYCLVWIDKKEKTINFLRNDKRPLFFAVMAGGGTVYWASEKGMLQFVLGRHTTKFEIQQLIVDKWLVYEFPLKHHLDKSCVAVEDLKGAVPEVAAFSPFLGTGYYRNWTGTNSAAAAETPIAEAKKESGKSVSIDSGKAATSGTSTTPLLPRPAPQNSVIQLGHKPRMKWDNDKQTWVEIHPTSPPQETTKKIISLGGTQGTSKSNDEKQESQSTEGTFCGPLFQDDGQMVGERDFSSGPKDISEVMKELFNAQSTAEVYEGYRQTIPNNWMAESQYIDFLKKGCLWCGDAQPDVKTNLWTDVDEFVCESCQKEQFCIDYICMTLGVSREEFDTKAA